MSTDSISNKSAGTDGDWLRDRHDEDIDFSDIPEWTPEASARTVARRGIRPIVRKEQVTLRLDADVLAWFKKQGKGYQTRVNDLLRAFVDAHRKRPAWHMALLC